MALIFSCDNCKKSEVVKAQDGRAYNAGAVIVCPPWWKWILVRNTNNGPTFPNPPVLHCPSCAPTTEALEVIKYNNMMMGNKDKSSDALGLEIEDGDV